MDLTLESLETEKVDSEDKGGLETYPSDSEVSEDTSSFLEMLDVMNEELIDGRNRTCSI